MSKIAVDWDSKTDNNNGFIYGIEYQDHNGNVIDVEWFKSEKERDREVNNEN
jgi:predicted lactoylglutathione lyase